MARYRGLLDNLSFANGVAVGHGQTFVLINETGRYRVMRYWLTGPKSGQAEPFIEELPAFPDNIAPFAIFVVFPTGMILYEFVLANRDYFA